MSNFLWRYFIGAGSHVDLLVNIDTGDDEEDTWDRGVTVRQSWRPGLAWSYLDLGLLQSTVAPVGISRLSRTPSSGLRSTWAMARHNVTMTAGTWTTLIVQMRERGRLMMMRTREQQVRRTAQRSGPSLHTEAAPSSPPPLLLRPRWEGEEK